MGKQEAPGKSMECAWPTSRLDRVPPPARCASKSTEFSTALIISAKTQPTDQASTTSLYFFTPIRISGARYQSVTTLAV